MNEIYSKVAEIVQRLYTEGIKPHIVEKDDCAYIQDPVFEVKRNRVIAETIKAILRVNPLLEKEKRIILKLTNQLKKNQNIDGSWNEIHPNYSQPSALITSIIGEALLFVFDKYPSEDLEKSLHLASKFVASQEKSPGYFLKSTQYTADHLNVDATCGAFLAAYGKKFFNDSCIKIVQQTAEHICNYQFLNGSYPYTIDKGNYPYHLCIPCIHYQGVTLYYLSKIQDVIKKDWLDDNIKKGTRWLSSVQNKNGKFNWSKSGLLLTYHLIGAYSFAFFSYVYSLKINEKYLEKANLCLDVLTNNKSDIFFRWESDPLILLPFSIPTIFRMSLIGNYPLKHKFERFGFGFFREIARRRYSSQVDAEFYSNLINILKIQTLSRESFNNYPDLFMTSEILDSLSSSIPLLEMDLNE